MTAPGWRVAADPAGAVALVVEALEAALAEAAPRPFGLGLPGGHTPRALYRALAARPGWPWERLGLALSDERLDPAAANAAALERELLEPLRALGAVPARLALPDAGLADPTEAAAAYARALASAFGPGPWPALDVWVLGLGADGHTASLFSGGPEAEAGAWVLGTARAPAPYPRRVSLTADALLAAPRLFFLVTGAAKRDALAALLAPDAVGPAARLTQRHPRVTIFCDRAAAPAAVARRGGVC